MTIEWNYLKESKQMHQGSQFEAHNTVHRFKVIDCGADATLINPQAVLDLLAAGGAAAGGYKAQVGTPFSYTDNSPVDGVTEYGQWITRSIDVSPMQNQRYSWDVTINQTNMGRLYEAPSETDGSPTLIGDIDCAFNQASTGRKQQAWRTNPTVADDTLGPADGAYGIEFCTDPWTFCSSEEDDIAGTDVAINKAQPIQITTSMTQVTIEYVVRGPITLADGTLSTPYVNSEGQSPFLAIPTLEAMIGQRNADDLGQFGAGYLLLDSVGVQPMHYEFKRVSLVFSYDPWKHAQQRPWTTTTGPVIGIEACPESENDDIYDILNLGARSVGWIQPYLSGFTFGETPDALFNDGFFTEFMAWMMGSYTAGVPGTCD